MKQYLIVGLALAALVVSGVFLVRTSRKASVSPDFPDGMHWLCTSCNHGFTTSRDQFADWVAAHPDQRLECPKCKRNTTFVARKCPLPDCGRYYTERNVVIAEKVCCPVCKQPLP